jgi:hypothetical protein
MEREMKRRTLDLIFATGGLFAAALILVLGLVLQNQADFADSYVHDQLAEQRITFAPSNALGKDTQASCLKESAGTALTSGKQAECYANNYIRVHLTEVNDGKTYAETSNAQRAVQTKLDAIADTTSADAQQLAAQNDALTGKVQTLFRGETLRGLLLTSYGFSIFGDRAQTAAYVCYALALVLFLAAVAGYIHAATKRADHVVLTQE